MLPWEAKMNRTMKQAVAWLMVLGIVLAGCATPVETQPPPTDTALPSFASPIRATPAREPTAVPTWKVVTEMPAIEPSVTAVVMPTLTVREPSIQQLETYLKVALPNRFYGFEGKPKLIYQDVSGDGRADLIVDGFLQVVVMLWTG